jgi:hypothetical protein
MENAWHGIAYTRKKERKKKREYGMTVQKQKRSVVVVALYMFTQMQPGSHVSLEWQRNKGKTRSLVGILFSRLGLMT